MTQDVALSILKTGANIFLTGEPGAGKTYTINKYIRYLREHGIEPAITASTGIAATHIGGMTIHSWSGIGIKKILSDYDVDKIASTERVAKSISRTKVLVVDEISMLDNTTLALVDRVCRSVKNSEEPFGGMQVIFVGDFFQLPPISKQNFNEQNEMFSDEPASPFAFDGGLWKSMSPIVCYISEQHRQSDEIFLEILSAIRAGNFDQNHKEHLDKRIKVWSAKDFADITKLYPHNENVDDINNGELEKLEVDEHAFKMEGSGRDNVIEALKRGCLSPEILKLKVGAKVMFTKNNFEERFVNGTQGIVIKFDENSGFPIVKTTGGASIEVRNMEWSVEENGKILARISQVPLRLAWAMTVHKSQGVSLDSAYIDLRRAFVEGQGYVALSRVRTLEGLHLAGYNSQALRVHPLVLEADINFRLASDNAEVAFDAMDEGELESMHRNFVVASGGTIESKPRHIADLLDDVSLYTKKKKGSGSLVTKESVKQKKNISEIVKESGFTEGTIIRHIEDLLRKGELSKSDIAYMKKGIEKEVDQICKAFIATKDNKLKPVFEQLKGKSSYETIRIARLFL
ncbi:MAG: AAA family ATPase [Pyrinomonadaceae bacterium]